MYLDSKVYSHVDLLEMFLYDLACGSNTVEYLFDDLESKALREHHQIIDKLDFLLGCITRLNEGTDDLDEYMMEMYARALANN